MLAEHRDEFLSLSDQFMTEHSPKQNSRLILFILHHPFRIAYIHKIYRQLKGIEHSYYSSNYNLSISHRRPIIPEMFTESERTFFQGLS